MKQTFHVAVVREGVEQVEDHCARSAAPSIGDRMKWFVNPAASWRGAPDMRQAPHVVIGVRESDVREELGGNDPVIVLVPLPSGDTPPASDGGSGIREPRRPRPTQGS